VAATDNELQTLLTFDPLARAEEITGKDSHDNEGTVWTGMVLAQAHNRAKEAALKANDDSTFSNKTSDYLRIIKAEGFRKVLEIDIPECEHGYLGDKFFVYWHEDGILLKFDTYFGGDSINGGNFYYNWKPNAPESGYRFISSGHWNEGVLVGYHDAREAIRFRIKRFRDNGQLLAAWIEQPCLWLLHYQDTKVQGYDHKAINAQRIAMLPEHVQRAIRGGA
jgi:hypothetical protein